MIEALYIHIPFCKKRCFYCNFDTQATCDDALLDAYIDALSLQIRRASRAGLLGAIKTIYIGGGTPTYLGARRLSSLIYIISLSVKLEQVDEFTIEANPESINEHLIKDIYALGVDRISLGVQSFCDEDLKAYGRVHNSCDVQNAISAIKTRFDNFSLDLICGAQTQSLESWKKCVELALKTEAKHISIYPLSVESGTPLCDALNAGTANVASEDLQADMMLAASEILENANMKRYEVASYAFKGFEAKHNIAYWTQNSYLGLGAASSSMMNAQDFNAVIEAGLFDANLFSNEGSINLQNSSLNNIRIRFKASPNIDEFISTNAHTKIELDVLDEHEAILEDVMLGFRLSLGPSENLLQQACAKEPRLKLCLQDLYQKELVYKDGNRFLPTEKGWLCGNEIFASIINLAN